MKLRAIVKREQYRETWRVYCPMMGDDIGHGFPTEEDAKEAAERLGFEVIAHQAELADVEPLELNGQNYTSLRWFIANSDMRAIANGYASLRLYEAHIKVCERDADSVTKAMYEGLSVGTSIMLEGIADDFNGRYLPHYMWTNLARYENEQARLRGEERITTASGSCELI